MFRSRRNFAWLRLVTVGLVLLTMGTALHSLVDRQFFDKSVLRSTALIESLRLQRPEGIGAAEWNESVNITRTAFGNVCTYDPRFEKSRKIMDEIQALEKSSHSDGLGKLRQIWETLYYKCSSAEKTYLDKMRKSMQQKTGLD
jgi:hypothetical protein